MNAFSDRLPLILIDVDGVLNPLFSSKERSRAVYHDGFISRRTWNNVRVTVKPEHGFWLQKLAEETGAELAWATMWSDPNQHIAPLVNLPELPVAPVDLRLKARRVMRWTSGRPVVWFDDTDWELLTARSIAAHNRQSFLPVQVESRAGLTQENVEEARKWLVSLRTCRETAEERRGFLTCTFS